MIKIEGQTDSLSLCGLFNQLCSR